MLADDGVPHAFPVVRYWYQVATSVPDASYMWEMVSDVLRCLRQSALKQHKSVLDALLLFVSVGGKPPGPRLVQSVLGLMKYRRGGLALWISAETDHWMSPCVQLMPAACLCIILDLQAAIDGVLFLIGTFGLA